MGTVEQTKHKGLDTVCGEQRRSVCDASELLYEGDKVITPQERAQQIREGQTPTDAELWAILDAVTGYKHQGRDEDFTAHNLGPAERLVIVRMFKQRLTASTRNRQDKAFATLQTELNNLSKQMDRVNNARSVLDTITMTLASLERLG